jgi:hypothetical protein
MTPKLIKDHRIKTRDRFQVAFAKHETATFNCLKDALEVLSDLKEQRMCLRSARMPRRLVA